MSSRFLNQFNSRIGSSDDILHGCPRNHTGSCPACQKLSKIDQRIEAARQQLAQLLEERGELAATLNQQHDAFLRRLPLELVSRVFVNCLPFAPSLQVLGKDFDEKAHVKSLLNLGDVCHNWRRTARRTPELWVIFSTTITQKNCISLIPIAQDWLRRTLQRPLFLRIHTETPIDMVTLLSAQRVFENIGPLCSRIRVLDIKGHFALFNFICSTLSKQSLSSLEHLTLIQFDQGQGIRLNASPTHLMANCMLNHTAFDRLTHFSTGVGQNTSTEDCINLLKFAVCLSEAWFEHVVGDPRASPLTHNSLQNFRIRSGPPRLWDALSFPSLKSLVVIRPGAAEGCIAVKNFIQRSGCNIQALAICEAKGTDATEMIEVLRLTPDLRDLTILGGCRHGHLVSAMDAAATKNDAESSTTGFLGKLVGLEYDFPTHWPSLVLFLVTMASRRRRTLQWVDIRISGGYPNISSTRLPDEDMVGHITNAAQGIRLRMSDDNKRDLLDILRQIHSL